VPSLRKATAIAGRPSEVWFYTAELSQLPDGRIFLSLSATSVDEDGPQLVHQEIASERVANIDEALSIIKAGFR